MLRLIFTKIKYLGASLEAFIEYNIVVKRSSLFIQKDFDLATLGILDYWSIRKMRKYSIISCVLTLSLLY